MKFQGARLEDNSGLSLAQSELMMLLLKNMDDDRPLKKGSFCLSLKPVIFLEHIIRSEELKSKIKFNIYLYDVDPEGLDWPCSEEFR